MTKLPEGKNRLDLVKEGLGNAGLKKSGRLVVGIHRLKEDPKNERRTFRNMQGLIESIKGVGLIEPITVTADEDGQTYQIITGHRRFRAAKAAGLVQIEVLIREPDDEVTRRVKSIISNVQREDVGPIEMAEALQSLLDEDERIKNQEELSKTIGKDKTWVSGMLRILSLPVGLQQKVGSTQLSVYIKTMFTGTSVTINLAEDQLINAGTDSAYYPRIRYQIDGGATTDVQLAGISSIAAATGLSSGIHSLVITFPGVGGGNSSGPDRWQVPVQSIKFTGLTLDDGASVSLPTLLSKRMIVYGDSISEGVRVNGISGSSPNADQDATKAVPWLLAEDLGAEVGFRALGGGGWTTVGSGGVPPIYSPGDDTDSMWDKYSAGNSLLSSGSFSPAPDYIYMNHGTNDQGSSDASVIASIDGWLPAVRTAAPNADIFLVIPFGQFKASAITSAYDIYVSANPQDKRVFLIDLGSSAAVGLNSFGTPTAQAADGLHPYAATDASLESQMLPVIQSDLNLVTPPVISAISAAPTQTSAAITWTTDKVANSQIEYGPTSAYGSETSLDIATTTSHSETLSGLASATTYHYAVISADVYGNSATSSDRIFTTSAVPAPTPTPPVSTGVGVASGGGGYFVPTTVATPSLSVCTAGSLYNIQTGSPCLIAISAPTRSPSTLSSFTRSLTVGARGSDVASLQQYLNSHGFPVSNVGPGSPGHETDFFGAATRGALIRFQKADGIKPASGYFGPLTRAYVSTH